METTTTSKGINFVINKSSDKFWKKPKIVAFKEYKDSIEITYKKKSKLQYITYQSHPPLPVVFKIIFSCQEGLWHKSEPIYGEIIPAKEETYEFN